MLGHDFGFDTKSYNFCRLSEMEAQKSIELSFDELLGTTLLGTAKRI
jgi:hypothetical protein